MQEVVSADLDLVEPVAAEDLDEDDGSGDDHRCALRVEAGQAAALVEREGGEPGQLPLGRGEA